jgi:hypothetical protein
MGGRVERMVYNRMRVGRHRGPPSRTEPLAHERSWDTRGLPYGGGCAIDAARVEPYRGE